LLSHALIFLMTVSLVFIGFGAGASFLGDWLHMLLSGCSGNLIERIAGIFIIIMRLFIAVLMNSLFLMQEKIIHSIVEPAGYMEIFFIGLRFAAGWTSYIRPIFGSILILAASNPGQGLFYTFMYVIGFALPFLVLTFFLGSTKWIVKHSGIIMKFGAVIMIIMGILLFFGLIPVISGYLLDLVEGTWLSKLG